MNQYIMTYEDGLISNFIFIHAKDFGEAEIKFLEEYKHLKLRAIRLCK